VGITSKKSWFQNKIGRDVARFEKKGACGRKKGLRQRGEGIRPYQKHRFVMLHACARGENDRRIRRDIHAGLALYEYVGRRRCCRSNRPLPGVLLLHLLNDRDSEVLGADGHLTGARELTSDHTRPQLSSSSKSSSRISAWSERTTASLHCSMRCLVESLLSLMPWRSS